MPKVSTCFHVSSTPFFVYAVPYQHASNPFLGADQGGIEGGGGGGPHTFDTWRLYRKPRGYGSILKAAKQTIGAKWTQLIPHASGHIIGFPERHADGAAGATNHCKNSVSRLSYLFAHLHLLSYDSFSSDLLSSNLSLLSASALLCFSSVHIVGSLTSKLPSINHY